MSRPRRLLPCTLLAAACASTPAPQRDPIAPPAAPAPAPALPPAPPLPGLRLDDTARPLHYTASLVLDPDAAAFDGSIEIEVELARPTAFLWLNATELSGLAGQVAAGDDRQAVAVVRGDDTTVGLRWAQPLGPGRITVALTYRGVISSINTQGVFKETEGGASYLYSQFEPTDARRAFPCFDQPSFKVPWRLDITAPAGDRVYADTPAVEVAPAAGHPGMLRHAFAETVPLPSYLVAFAVGPFDEVDAGTAGANQVPVRIITPRGRAADAAYAAEVTGELLARIETYVGIPYPFPKLDVVSLPLAVSWGAMENPGLITCVQSLVLGKPGDDTIKRQRSYATTMAHEIAHMWFGDLVTMVWWDDVWLNESFASWMADEIVAPWRPGWNVAVDAASSRSRVMRQDTLQSARRIRQPIESAHDITNAFDGITYQKGRAVLAMFEAFVGPERFRAAVQAYLRAHAHGNASAADFLAALGGEAGADVAAAAAGFLEQPGVPLVSAELVCARGAAPALRLSQRRYLPRGSAAGATERWQVPICVRWGSGPRSARACRLLAETTATMPLPGARGCPDWVVVNDGALGYYRVDYRGDLLARLLGKQGGRRGPLSLQERVGVIDDVGALAESGELPPADALALVAGLAGDPSRPVVQATVRIVTRLSERELVADEVRPSFQRFVRALYGKRARALGLAARPGEEEETRMLRDSILLVTGTLGEDAAIIAEAKRLTDAYLVDPAAIDADLRQTILTIAARNGDLALFERMHAAASREPDRKRRNLLLEAMGDFRDPAVVQVGLELAMSDELDPRDADPLLFGPLEPPQTRQLAYDFIKQHADALAARQPPDGRASLVHAGDWFCDEEHEADVAAFFGPRAASWEGGPRDLAQVVESIGICAANRAAAIDGVTAFLARY